MKVFSAMKAIIKKNNSFLVLEHDFNGEKIYDLPGGKVEYGENPLDTLKREVKEETMLDINIIKSLGVIWFFRRSDKNQVVCNTYLCETLSDKIDISKNPTNEKIVTYRWIDFKDSDKINLEFYNIKNILKEI
jgi:8-oxo-dGTP diphosphatase